MTIDTPVRVSWCYSCGAVGPGWHDGNGDFDQWSVEVTEKEVEMAIANTYNKYRHTTQNRLISRWNIAFGKHIGTYPNG